MPIACQAYYTVRNRLCPFLCGLSKPQLTNLSLLVFGLFAAGNCQLPRIAAKLPLLVGAASLTQRLRRLLMNEAIHPTTLYQPVARFLLSCFVGGSVRLILDATDLGGRLPVLFVAVAYRGRALPLAWRMLPAMGCSEFAEQKALLSEVAVLVPPGMEITLLADREYGSVDMTRWCLSHGWHFCLQVKKNRWIIESDGQRKQIARLPLLPGGRFFVGNIRLPALSEPLSEQRLCLCCGWSRENKDDEPWYILSDLPADQHTFYRVLALYNIRFHIEEMFRDFKEFGFRLETTHLREKERVSRLLLCVCLAHVWLMNAGVWVSKRGFRRQVDRHKKRQLSYFQIGWRFLQKLLACGQVLRCEMEAYA
jgi:hypothetical protein